MDLTHCHFLTSAHREGDFPPDDQPEVAFAGRSNAGKSSALNALTGQTGLARVSKTPGRTQLVNFFELPQGPRLVDLPGYGFAQVPEEMRRHWGVVINDYFRRRRGLRGLILLMDIRHPLGKLDAQLLDAAVAFSRPCHVLLTKSDKLGRGAAAKTLAQVGKALPPGVSAQLFSATERTGVDVAREQVLHWLGGQVIDAT